MVLRVRKMLSCSYMTIRIPGRNGKNAGRNLCPTDRAQQILQDTGPMTFSDLDNNPELS